MTAGWQEHDAAVTQARDVIAFGQEVGRVLSDGRVVGRAEPFAKVFPSSRDVKRVVGPTAWVILEDVALDARLDSEGRLVAETNVRRIAANLGLSRNTVAKHLARLREHGFVLHEEVRAGTDGRFDTARYVLDPSAAVERFTFTPDRDDSAEPRPCRSSCDAGADTCRNSCDAGPCRSSGDTGQFGHERPSTPVSQSARHRGSRHNRDSAAVVEQQQTADVVAVREPADAAEIDEQLLARLTGLDADPAAATALLAAHPAEQIRDALDAVGGTDARKPAGWVVAALRGGWEVAELAADQRKLRDRRRRGEIEATERAAAQAHSAAHLQRQAGWAAVAVEALSEDQLAALVGRLTAPVPGLGRRALPAVRARLAAVTAAVHATSPDSPLGGALMAAAEQPDPPAGVDGLPAHPDPSLDDQAIDERLRAAVVAADTHVRSCSNRDEEVLTR